MTTIVLDPNSLDTSICKQLGHKYFGYTGKKFKVVAKQNPTIQLSYQPSGGSYTMTVIIDRSGNTILSHNPFVESFNSSNFGKSIPLQPNNIAMQLDYFCGKCMGITYTIHQNELPNTLESCVDLTEDELKVIEIFCKYKSSHRKGYLSTVDPQGNIQKSLLDRKYLSKVGNGLSPSIVAKNVYYNYIRNY